MPPVAARLSLAALALCMLAACGGGSQGPTPNEAAEAADQAAEDEALGRDTDATVLDDMIQTEDKARAVEDLTLGRKGELDDALDAAEGDGAAAGDDGEER